jgi:glycosyltransferase involved in cell wall biosynthesis
MAAYIRRHGIQLVHAFDTPTDVFAVPVARAIGVPVISSQLCFRELNGGFMRRLLRITDRLSDAVLVNCRALERHLTADEKVAAERIRLCHNGVDTAEFHPAAGERPEALRGASLVIGTVCALRPEKRVDLLLEAFARVRRLRDGMRLAVVGSGDLLPDLQARCRALGLENCCVFQPAVPRVAGWMRAMDVFVLPSSSEAFSNALLEAMACGCCPVGSDVGGMSELIAHGDTGLLFPSGHVAALAQRLETLIRNDDMRRNMGAAAARVARGRFSIDRAAERMAEIYEGLLHRRRMVRAA